MDLRGGLALANAILTTVSVGCAIRGRAVIKQKKVAEHRRWMYAAYVFSALFMVGFVARIILYGLTPFETKNVGVKIIHLLIVGLHDGIAVISIPLVSMAFGAGWLNRIATHKKLGGTAYVVWVISCLSGIVVYLMVYQAQKPPPAPWGLMAKRTAAPPVVTSAEPARELKR